MQLTKTSHVMPKRGHQKDKYEGSFHPTTKLRHGKGVYQYQNSFFTYEGQYHMGRKHGQGTLKMKDGTVIKGTFENDELNGQAQITYSHGASYRGNLCSGQKDGKGIMNSMFEEYRGEWKNNNFHGQGCYKNNSTAEEYEGEFQRGKFHGKGKTQKWNYSYEGSYHQGLKQGEGIEKSYWSNQDGCQGVGRFEYLGSFKCDKFQGQGLFKSKDCKYQYKGQFFNGNPCLYPNQFRIQQSFNVKTGEEVNEGQKSLVANNQQLQYQLEGDSLNLYIQTVYQGPQELDPVQPSPEQIQNLIKNWQNDNKKNKSPPPMPDFNQPRMLKPQLVLVMQESGRPICIKLLKQVEGKQEEMKVDYRNEIDCKRKENQEVRQQALKKAEDDGGKKGGKKDNKGEPELKVNLFKDTPSRNQTKLQIQTEQGKTVLRTYELPDDFPPGKYILEIGTPFTDFGRVQPLRKEFTVKAKAGGGKKK